MGDVGGVRPAPLQQWLEDLLKEEVTEPLGRPRCERRAAVDAGDGYRNGYGKPRRLARCPRDRQTRARVAGRRRDPDSLGPLDDEAWVQGIRRRAADATSRQRRAGAGGEVKAQGEPKTDR